MRPLFIISVAQTPPPTVVPTGWCQACHHERPRSKGKCRIALISGLRQPSLTRRRPECDYHHHHPPYQRVLLAQQASGMLVSSLSPFSSSIPRTRIMPIYSAGFTLERVCCRGEVFDAALISFPGPFNSLCSPPNRASIFATNTARTKGARVLDTQRTPTWLGTPAFTARWRPSAVRAYGKSLTPTG